MPPTSALHVEQRPGLRERLRGGRCPFRLLGRDGAVGGAVVARQGVLGRSRLPLGSGLAQCGATRVEARIGDLRDRGVRSVVRVRSTRLRLRLRRHRLTAWLAGIAITLLVRAARGVGPEHGLAGNADPAAVPVALGGVSVLWAVTRWRERRPRTPAG
ncbi:hypothetical protein [Streptomyces broussonetiae]|uniref:Uncharacterized protein n=1 Tax=Streptomyces broussonetiae TaxID=2686304 RepID=A0A6I6N0A3_9ACTN|nr:hypothetical protein [Streptomyces broussonetiae]QHA06608.1 hypothetical protein GQF42_27965 [Streptomyces broussonetiae]